MEIIYDIQTDPNLDSIQEKIGIGKSGYRTKWGLYGSDEWLKNLEAENLIENIEAKISNLYFSGHNDFAEFEIDNGSSKYHFPRIGKTELYKLGLTVLVKGVRNKYISPSSGLENLLIPIRVEIL